MIQKYFTPENLFARIDEVFKKNKMHDVSNPGASPGSGKTDIPSYNPFTS